MDERDEHSSEPEESMDAFVRRKLKAERNTLEEALARKALVDSLVGRKPTPRKDVRLSQSVVMARGARNKPAPKVPVDDFAVEDESDDRRQIDEEDVSGLESIEADVFHAESEEYSGPEAAADERIVAEPNVPADDPVSEAVADEPEHKGRVSAERKMEAFAAVVAAAGDPRQFTPASLMTAVAKQLGVPEGGIKTHWNRYLSAEQRRYLLYGKKGKKITQTESKFGIAMQLRAEIRARGEPAPTKSEFIPLVAKRLGLTEQSTATYIYERLSGDQKAQLDFGLPGNYSGYTCEEQIGILKIVRKEMKDAGLPAPRHTDLAIAAAPRLKQKVDSVRTFITSLSAELKEELEFLQSRSAKLNGLSAFHVKEGFLGAFAVLRLRKMKLSSRNLQKILNMKRPVIESYLAEHPDIAHQLIDEDTQPR